MFPKVFFGSYFNRKPWWNVNWWKLRHITQKRIIMKLLNCLILKYRNIQMILYASEGLILIILLKIIINGQIIWRILNLFLKKIKKIIQSKKIFKKLMEIEINLLIKYKKYFTFFIYLINFFIIYVLIYIFIKFIKI